MENFNNIFRCDGCSGYGNIFIRTVAIKELAAGI